MCLPLSKRYEHIPFMKAVIFIQIVFLLKALSVQGSSIDGVWVEVSRACVENIEATFEGFDNLKRDSAQTYSLLQIYDNASKFKSFLRPGTSCQEGFGTDQYLEGYESPAYCGGPASNEGVMSRLGPSEYSIEATSINRSPEGIASRFGVSKDGRRPYFQFLDGYLIEHVRMRYYCGESFLRVIYLPVPLS